MVDDAADGETGLTLALSRPYDVAIIDRMLPKMDGLELVEELREHANATPVLFLSALSEVDDRVKGLKAGGDDYLTKPYAFVELLARLDALMRRRQPAAVKTRSAGRRSGARPADPHRQARQRRDRPATPRIPPAGISDAPCRPGGDAHHACWRAFGSIISIRRPT